MNDDAISKARRAVQDARSNHYRIELDHKTIKEAAGFVRRAAYANDTNHAGNRGVLASTLADSIAPLVEVCRFAEAQSAVELAEAELDVRKAEAFEVEVSVATLSGVKVTA